MKDRRGVSIIFAVFVLLVLSVLALAIFSMISSDISSAVMGVNSSRALYVADAGIEIGAQAINYDVAATDGNNTTTPSNNGYCGVFYIEGYNYGSTGMCVAPENACLHGVDWNNANTTQTALIGPTAGSSLVLWDFKQRRNLIGGRIVNLEMRIRARRVNIPGIPGPPITPIVALQYTLDGEANWNEIAQLNIDNNGWSPAAYRVFGFPMVLAVDWNLLMNSSGSNFRIRAMVMNNGNMNCEVDWLSLRATVEVDSYLEPWSTSGKGYYLPKGINFPVSLGGATLDYITVVDEAGKINLNYSITDTTVMPKIIPVLKYLMETVGVSDPTGLAQTITARVGSGQLFSSIEELKDPGGIKMEADDFNKIKPYITVYSWVNNSGTRPGIVIEPKARAPININTANTVVLSAVFKCSTDDAFLIEWLVTDIMSRRESQPFTHMFSSYATQAATRDLTSFAGYIQLLIDGGGGRMFTVSQISALEQIRGNADATYYNKTVLPANPPPPVGYNDWTEVSTPVVEFCYSSNAFAIRAEAKSKDVSRLVRSIYGDRYDYPTYGYNSVGTFYMPTDMNDSDPEQYWREERGSDIYAAY
ncbi:MAG: hypothetical protein HQ575_05455 [Candidatus Omnitrophica bacterium]|nr:hypothetical protein [Candidatus Omnitrophota bacterium]